MVVLDVEGRVKMTLVDMTLVVLWSFDASRQGLDVV
jgi:hypothetical protein